MTNAIAPLCVTRLSAKAACDAFREIPNEVLDVLSAAERAILDTPARTREELLSKVAAIDDMVNDGDESTPMTGWEQLRSDIVSLLGDAIEAA